MFLNDFLLFLFLIVCTPYVVVVKHTVIFLVAHKLHRICMNNQGKFTSRSSNLKVHRANSQTISPYPVRFSTDIIFSSLVSFDFCPLIFLCFLFFKLKMYILIHIRKCREKIHQAGFRKQDVFLA